MLAIPLPFVVSLLLLVLAGSLWGQRRQSALLACLFLVLCAVTTALVGLRWTFDMAYLKVLQPVFACLIPVMAYWVFSKSKTQARFYWPHFFAPVAIVLSAISYPLWEPPIDVLITVQYIVYSALIWRSAGNQNEPPEFVRINDWTWAIRAERVAALMLLFSALIDGVLTVDFMLADGRHSMWILSIGHAFLLPTLSLAVMGLALMTAPSNDEHFFEEVFCDVPSLSDSSPSKSIETEDDQTTTVMILNKVSLTVTEQKLYLDPDLTLARIARKAGIPARQISSAINKVTGQNISQWVNKYRIEHAKESLINSNDPITEIFLNSGFQTKSNFHREFTRLTGVSPSVFRRENALPEEGEK
jgi:AraC-like DNA-binding protein